MARKYRAIGRARFIQEQEKRDFDAEQSAIKRAFDAEENKKARDQRSEDERLAREQRAILAKEEMENRSNEKSLDREAEEKRQAANIAIREKELNEQARYNKAREEQEKQKYAREEQRQQDEDFVNFVKSYGDAAIIDNILGDVTIPSSSKDYGKRDANGRTRYAAFSSGATLKKLSDQYYKQNIAAAYGDKKDKLTEDERLRIQQKVREDANEYAQNAIRDEYKALSSLAQNYISKNRNPRTGTYPKREDVNRYIKHEAQRRGLMYFSE